MRFIETADGSPTLRLGPEDDSSEAMHSLKGAFSETSYIYGTAIETCLSNGFPTRILSMGLGLGYVELLATGLILKNKVSAAELDLEQVRGESFELVPELREWFSGWVAGRDGVPEDFKTAYEQILQRTSELTGVDGKEIRTQLSIWLERGQWRIREALSSQTEFTERFGCICFDAFSSKSTPDVWTEPFLLDFFTRACAESCVLSTYACTGALKRSLRASGFEVSKREGFSSKRDSTFAVRRMS